MARDVVIVGGGHNALVSATYLALAGKSVTILERLDHVGGAAVSEQAFEGVDARLSRYSYLVSLLPARIIRELGLDIRLARRRYSSYTPEPGTDRGLLVDNTDARATATALGQRFCSLEHLLLRHREACPGHLPHHDGAPPSTERSACGTR